jgi:acetyltransferase-like isoleucine patch superfamily enzyme
MSEITRGGQQLAHDWFLRPVPENVSWGRDTWLHSSYSFLHCQSRRATGVQLGHDTGVYTETHFDLGPDGQVTVGDYCTLAGPIFSTNGGVHIGDYVLVSREVVFADRPFALPPADGVTPPGPSLDIIVGNDAWIGTRAIILAGARIGDGAIVGAGAVVDGEVAAYTIVAGNPARVVGQASRSPFPVKPSLGVTLK